MFLILLFILIFSFSLLFKRQKEEKGKKRSKDEIRQYKEMPTFLMYSVAAPSSPCSNVPVSCPLCPKSNPAVWKYFLKVHFQDKHKTAPLMKYEHLWKLSNFEISEMKKFWSKRMNISAKRTKKSKLPPLVVSEDHRARIPSR